MLNKCSFIGHLGGDPEVKHTPGGDAVANFTVACTERWKKDGQQQEKTEWVKCVVWRKLAEICGEYLHKGSLVYVEGKMQTRQWDDKDGNKRYTTEIVISEMKMLGGKQTEDPGMNRREEPPMPDDDSSVPF